MASQEAPELPSYHVLTEWIVIYGAVLSKRNPETNCVTPILTLKWIGNAKTYSCHKLDLWHDAIQLGWNPNSNFFLRSEGLGPHM